MKKVLVSKKMIKKNKITLLLLSAMALFSSLVFAGNDCQVVSARVVSIMPWEDGATFINLDRPNNCGCAGSTRFGFYPTDQHAKTYLAEALTAFATNSLITILGNAGCSVHGNSASVYTIILGGGM